MAARQQRAGQRLDRLAGVGAGQAGGLEAGGDEVGQRPDLVEALQLFGPGGGVGGQFPGRDDDVVAILEAAAARLDGGDDGIDLVAVDVEDADAAGQHIHLQPFQDLGVGGIGALGVAEHIVHALVQHHGAAGHDVAAHLLAHADRRPGVADDGDFDVVDGWNCHCQAQRLAVMASRRASSQRWPCAISGSRWVPSAHSFQALTKSRRSPPMWNWRTSSIFSSA